MNVEIAQILSQIVAFLLMLIILKRFAWQPLLKLLDQRQERIQAEFHEIEKQKKAADDLLALYNTKLKEINHLARDKIKKAIEEGKQAADDLHKEAQRQSKLILNKAQAEIEKEMAKATSKLQNNLVNMVIDVSEKVIQKELNTEEQKKLIAKFVEQESFHDRS